MTRRYGSLVVLIFVLFLVAPYTHRLFVLFRMPLVWHKISEDSVISQERYNFDVTFRSYDDLNATSWPESSMVVPRRRHHVLLGDIPAPEEWVRARTQCQQIHSNWTWLLWDTRKANIFVQEQFPDLWDMWSNYPYLVQRVDALRYMVLYTYGGAILDLDLECKRSLEPLRRFDFVAPAAHPAGFSIGMMMASVHHPFLKSIIDNLPSFNRRWGLIPYATVMFSTGCHFASTIFTTQTNRSAIRILSGTPQDPNMHMLNGVVDTPLFRHLGSSSWHGQDAAFFRVLSGNLTLCILAMVILIRILLGNAFLRRYRGTMRGKAIRATKWNS